MPIPGLTTAIAGITKSGAVVPSPVNWGDITGSAYSGGGNSAQAITGISESIVLRIEISSFSGSGAHALFANSDYLSVYDGSLMDLVIAPLNSISFFAWDASGSGSPASYTVTVKYKSAGSSTFDQTLDTFTVTLS